MNRRHFLGAGFAGGIGIAANAWAKTESNVLEPNLCSPEKIAGLTLEELAADYRRQLFDEYLPFWEKGGYDEERGGFMCYLRDDGSVQDDRKDIWYQGRGIWVYSFLYNNIDRNPKWLEMAKKSRDFMVKNMHRGDGTWIDTVDRFGKPTSGIDYSRNGNIYGALFAAVGLIQFAKATGSSEDLELAKTTIRKAVELYESPSYPGAGVPEVDDLGLRAQGHSFMLIWVVPQLLEMDSAPWFESLPSEHLELIATRFWNEEYGISNEALYHDYSRIPALADWMVPGHSIEAQWMAMEEAMRVGDESLALVFKKRMRRLIEMNWDYVYSGIGDTRFHVFSSDRHPLGPDFEIKAMWAQAEVLVGCMLVWARTGEQWAQEWYERTWKFVERTMITDRPIWRQAVDRLGNNKHRPGISIYRKGNFHQPRCLMMNVLQVEKVIGKNRSNK